MMIKRFSSNLAVTGLGSVVGLLATGFLVAKLSAEDYGYVAMAVLVVNGAALLNIFRPRTIGLVAAGRMKSREASSIASSAFFLATCYSMVACVILLVTSGAALGIPVGIAAFFVFLSTVVSDDLEGRGLVLYSTGSRNLAWIIYYLLSVAAVWLDCDLVYLYWFLAVIFAGLFVVLFVRSDSFRLVSMRGLFGINPISEIVANRGVAGANVASFVLGGADRWALWLICPGSVELGVYSAIGDLIVKSHVLFRVGSAVGVGEIVSGRVSAEALWKRVSPIILLGFLMVYPAQMLANVIVGALVGGGAMSQFVVAMFVSALPVVACGYFSVAVLHVRGDRRTPFVIYAPTAVVYALLCPVAVIVGGVGVLAFIYAISRLSDLWLLALVVRERAKIGLFVVLFISSVAWLGVANV